MISDIIKCGVVGPVQTTQLGQRAVSSRQLDLARGVDASRRLDLVSRAGVSKWLILASRANVSRRLDLAIGIENIASVHACIIMMFQRALYPLQYQLCLHALALELQLQALGALSVKASLFPLQGGICDGLSLWTGLCNTVETLQPRSQALPATFLSRESLGTRLEPSITDILCIIVTAKESSENVAMLCSTARLYAYWKYSIRHQECCTYILVGFHTGQGFFWGGGKAERNPAGPGTKTSKSLHNTPNPLQGYQLMYNTCIGL